MNIIKVGFYFFSKVTRKLFFWVSCVAFIIVNCQIACAGPKLDVKTVRQLDRFIHRYMSLENIPSIAIGIWQGKETLYRKAFGRSNLKTGEKRGLNDSFRIASITKTFIATEIYQLIDQGKLKSSDQLAKWFPDFPNANKITISDLLNMRSGIPDAFDLDFWEKYVDNPLQNLSTQDIVERAKHKRDRFGAPNKESVYSNINYIFLQLIIEKVTGNNIQDQLKKTIFEPLGLKSTFFPVRSTRLPGKLRGYIWDAKNKRFIDKTLINPRVPGGAGAVISTLHDLKIYAKALCRGVLLKNKTQLERMRVFHRIKGRAPWTVYGGGVFFRGHFCGHAGTAPGFSTEMWYLPEKDVTVIISANRLDVDDRSKTKSLFQQVTKMLFPNDVNW